jgi:two-component system, sensor histidine kinase and response regulator
MSIDAPAAGESSPTRRRLIVVDGDPELCRQLAAELAIVSYAIEVSPDAEHARAQLEVAMPDLAIVALELPDHASLALIRTLKQQLGPAVHIIATLDRDDEHRRAAAFEAGADDLVVKPAVMSDLRLRLAAATRNQRAFVEAKAAREVANRRMAYGAEAGAMLAHDLNNGLAVGLLNMQYLRDVLSLDSDQAEAFETTIRSLRRMSSLVINFVEIARFEDAEISPEIALTALPAMLASVLEVNGLAVGVAVTVDCEPDLTGDFDRALIERVLHNLVGNAARYSRPGGSMTVAARRWDDRGIEISVTNTGPPISETIRPHLFEKHARGAGAKRGMGLYFCRLVAEAHGGTVHHESTERGPSFIVRLPDRA